MNRPPRIVLVAGAVALVAGLTLAGWSWWRGRLDASGVLQASGRIEVTEVNVSSKVTGRVAVLHVDEGADVEAGQFIAELSNPLTRKRTGVLFRCDGRPYIARELLHVVRNVLCGVENGFQCASFNDDRQTRKARRQEIEKMVTRNWAQHANLAQTIERTRRIRRH